MRTTIHLDDRLLEELKRFAAETGRTLTSLIQDAVRESLARRRRGRDAKRRPEVPVFHGTGLLPGVDLHDSAALLDRMNGTDAAP
jgi:hypothetical protein